MYEKLKSNSYVSTYDLLNQRQKSREFEIKISDLQKDKSDVLEQIKIERNSLRLLIENRPIDLSKNLQNYLAEKIDIVNQLEKKQKGAAGEILISPQDAIVLSMGPISVGSVVSGAEPIITLVPMDSKLKVLIKINEKDIIWLKNGAKVTLELNSFAAQRYGYMEGKLVNISPDVYQTPQNFYTEQAPILSNADSNFIGVVEITKDSLFGLPDYFRLMPGLKVTAYINVGKRRIITYFIDPIVSTITHSIREP